MYRVIISSLDIGIGKMKVNSHQLPTSLISHTSPCIQCTRFYRPRKPFWLPMGKTKMFRVHKKPSIPEEESVELSRLYNVYRTNMKSLRQYFKEQLMAQTTGIEVIEEQKKRLVEQHAVCIKENDIWNAEVKKIREERLAKAAKEREEKILEKIMTHEKKQELWIEQLDAHIISEKENAKSFITPNNIDEAIEIALSNYVDHNFCIDKAENIYKGRYGKPPPKSILPKSDTNQEEANKSLEARN